MRFNFLIISNIVFSIIIGLFTYSRIMNPSKSGLIDLLYVVMGVSLILFSLYDIYRSSQNHKKDIPDSDEFSKRLFEVASSRSFTISFFVWPLLFLVTKRYDLSVADFLLIGLSSMVLIFAYYRYHFLKQGIRE